jgi:hypothetical protein
MFSYVYLHLLKTNDDKYVPTYLVLFSEACCTWLCLRTNRFSGSQWTIGRMQSNNRFAWSQGCEGFMNMAPDHWNLQITEDAQFYRSLNIFSSDHWKSSVLHIYEYYAHNSQKRLKPLLFQMKWCGDYVHTWGYIIDFMLTVTDLDRLIVIEFRLRYV